MTTWNSSLRTILLLFFACGAGVQAQVPESASWKSIGPYGGSVVAAAVSPLDPDLVLAGTPGAFEYGGLFRSTDGGATWSHAPVLGEVEIATIDFAPDGTAFVGTRGAGLWRSTDGGLDWTQLSLPAASYIDALAIAPGSNSEIWAARTSVTVSLYHSEDGGETWEIASIPGVYCRAIAFDPGDPDTLYVACGSGSGSELWLSTDGGSTWIDRHSGLPGTGVFALAHDGARVFAGTSAGLYASADQGLGWTGLHEGWPSPLVETLAVKAGEPGTILVGTRRGAHRSTDGGLSWDVAIENTRDLWINTLRFASGDGSRVLMGANALGFFQSFDGGQSFTRSTRGMTSLHVTSVAVHPQDSSYVAAAFEGTNEGGVFTTENGGRTWTLENLPTGRISQVAFSSQGILHAAHDGPLPSGAIEGVYRRDAGGTWQALGPDQGPSFETVIEVLRFSDQVPDVVVAGGSDATSVGGEATVWISPDAGSTWAKVHEGRVEREEVRDVEILSNDIMVAVFDAPYSSSTGGVLRSTDGGSSWLPSDTGLPPGFKGYSLCKVAGEPQSVFATHREVPAQTGGILESADGGASWISTGFEGVFMDLVCSPNDPEVLFAGFADIPLVRRSTDRGRTFSAFDDGLELAGAGLLGSRGDGVRLLHTRSPRPRLYLSGFTGVWVTELETDIFADGFESGDLGAWSSSSP